MHRISGPAGLSGRIVRNCPVPVPVGYFSKSDRIFLKIWPESSLKKKKGKLKSGKFTTPKAAAPAKPSAAPANENERNPSSLPPPNLLEESASSGFTSTTGEGNHSHLQSLPALPLPDNGNAERNLASNGTPGKGNSVPSQNEDKTCITGKGNLVTSLRNEGRGVKGDSSGK
ncbi:hypothetical protein BSL78_09695 [Apostichopus japonicus]|uniref:Uncharacterized protein n=1 Tax=Stichopus japonicus TaxID=307972 RepID=A0A2G8KZL9_STIJA|nr:hypothetical protein BSL78_09695 [Apostichopus japonicus]